MEGVWRDICTMVTEITYYLMCIWKFALYKQHSHIYQLIYSQFVLMKHM